MFLTTLDPRLEETPCFQKTANVPPPLSTPPPLPGPLTKFIANLSSAPPCPYSPLYPKLIYDSTCPDVLYRGRSRKVFHNTGNLYLVPRATRAFRDNLEVGSRFGSHRLGKRFLRNIPLGKSKFLGTNFLWQSLSLGF